MGLWRSPTPGSRRAARDREVRYLRQQGRYGPTLREVAPGFVVLVLVVAAPLALVVWLWSLLGRAGLVLGLLVVVGLAVVLVRWRRAVVRRRSGIYTAAELARLDRDGLAEAAARMLRRDGWRVRSDPWQGTPRLWARDPGGRRMEVTVRPDDTPVGGDAPAPAALRPVGGEAAVPGGILRLSVGRSPVPRRDVVWAARQGHVLLLDGQQLQAWAAGTGLTRLVGLPPLPPPRPAAPPSPGSMLG